MRLTRIARTAAGARLRRWTWCLSVLPIALLTLTSCEPNTITRSGDQVHHLWMIYLVAAIVVFILEGGAIIWFAVRYRRRRGDDVLPKQIHGHNRLEVVWTVVPGILLFTLLGMSLNQYENMGANPKPDLTVNVTAFQWQWSFGYADGNGKSLGVTQAAQGQTEGPVLYLPVQEKIRFVIKSTDVIHSFYVPAMFWKRDAIPGRTNVYTQELDASSAGHTYEGYCAELCGLNHSQMRFTVAPLTKADFQKWLSGKEQAQAKASTCAPSGTTVAITAKSIHFDKSCLAAPANTAFTITFDNMDSGVPHNVAIYADSSASKVLFRGALVTGSKSITYHVPALPAGTYYFRCDVHPTAMHGTFVVK